MVEEKIVIPLSNASGDGKEIDEELLHTADSTIDDLNIEDLDFDDFNMKVR